MNKDQIRGPQGEEEEDDDTVVIAGIRALIDACKKERVEVTIKIRPLEEG